MNRIRACVLAALPLLSLFAACGGGGSDQSSSALQQPLRVSGGGGIEGTGLVANINLAVTAEPLCGYEAVHVTIERVRVNQSATAGDGEAGWSEVMMDLPKRVDLGTLANGVLDPLGGTLLPPGRYTQMRLILVPNSQASPLANSITPIGGAEIALATPGAQQSGLRLNVGLDLPAGQASNFAIDFDGCKSIVKRGNSGQYELKPVISVIPVPASNGMRVIGYVDPLIAEGSTLATLQQGGTTVKASTPDSLGRFVLYPVPSGTYDLVINASGRVTTTISGVPVTSNAITTVNSQGFPISPAVSAMRTVLGTIKPSSATVRVLQTLGMGATVEVSWAAVDAGTGAFAVQLPIAAPTRTVFAADSTLLTFVPDLPATSKFSLEAKSNGIGKTVAIDTTVSVPVIALTVP